MSDFDSWYARNHPFDWFTKEMSEPVPTSVRLKIWAMCQAAWNHQEVSEFLSLPATVTPEPR